MIDRIQQTRKINSISVFGDRAESLRNKLLALLSRSKPLTEAEQKAIQGELKIKFSDDIGEGFKRDSDGQSLILNRASFNELVQCAVEEKKSDQVLEEYVIEDTERYSGFSKSESIAQQTLNNISDILERVHSRRTNSPSWILSLLLRSFGLKKDDYLQVKKLLERPDFIKVFAEYLNIKEKQGKVEANKVLDGKLQNQELNGQKLIKLCSFLKSVFDYVPRPFVNVFPLAFSLQNIFMPWLSDHVLKEDTVLKKVADTMVVLNPWIGDYCSEILGNFKQEIRNIKNSKGDNKIHTLSVNSNGENLEVGELNLTSLNSNEHKLQKIMKKVNEGFDRLFGKQNTLSSLAMTGILWLSGNGTEYGRFAAKYVDNPEFIKKFYKYLEGGCKENPDDVFKRSSLIAKIILGAVQFSRSMSEGFIKNTSNIFGLFYSIQNLFMPILSMFVKEGGFGKVVRFLRNANPLINELFVDHIGNFRKEILDIQRAPLSNLFPQFDPGIKKGLSNAIEYGRALLGNIRSFGQRFRFGGL